MVPCSVPMSDASDAARAAFLRLVACRSEEHVWALSYLGRLGPPGSLPSEEDLPIDGAAAERLLPQAYLAAWRERRLARVRAAEEAQDAWELAMADPHLPPAFLRDAVRWAVEGREHGAFLAAALMGNPALDRRTLLRLIGRVYRYSFIPSPDLPLSSRDGAEEAARAAMVRFAPRLFRAAERNPRLASTPEEGLADDDAEFVLAWLGVRDEDSLLRLAWHALRIDRTQGSLRSPGRKVGAQAVVFADELTWVGALLHDAMRRRPDGLVRLLSRPTHDLNLVSLALWVLRHSLELPTQARENLAVAAMRVLFRHDLQGYVFVQEVFRVRGGLGSLLLGEDPAMRAHAWRAVELMVEEEGEMRGHAASMLPVAFAHGSGLLWDFVLRAILPRLGPGDPEVQDLWRAALAKALKERALRSAIAVKPLLTQASRQLAELIAEHVARSLRRWRPDHADLLAGLVEEQDPSGLDAAQRLYLQVLAFWLQPSDGDPSRPLGDEVAEGRPRVPEDAVIVAPPAEDGTPSGPDETPVSGESERNVPSAAAPVVVGPDPTTGFHFPPAVVEAYRALLDRRAEDHGWCLKHADHFDVGLDELETYLPRVALPWVWLDGSPKPHTTGRVVFAQGGLSDALAAPPPAPSSAAPQATTETLVGVVMYWVHTMRRTDLPEGLLDLWALDADWVRPVVLPLIDHPSARVGTAARLLRSGVRLHDLKPPDAHPGWRMPPRLDELEDPLARYLLFLGQGLSPDLPGLARGQTCVDFDQASAGADLLRHAVHRHPERLVEAMRAPGRAEDKVALASATLRILTPGGLAATLAPNRGGGFGRGRPSTTPPPPPATVDRLLTASLRALLAVTNEPDEVTVTTWPVAICGGLFDHLVTTPHQATAVALEALLQEEGWLGHHAKPKLAWLFGATGSLLSSAVTARVLAAYLPEVLREVWRTALGRGILRTAWMLHRPARPLRGGGLTAIVAPPLARLRREAQGHVRVLLEEAEAYKTTTEAGALFIDEVRREGGASRGRVS